MKKVSKYIVIGAAITSVLTVFGIYVITDYSKKQDINFAADEAYHYSECVHWTPENGLDGYVEPTLTVGRYYLDGDTSKQYYEVLDDGSVQLKNADYVAMAATNLKDTDHNSPSFQEQVDWYENKFYPTIFTIHGMQDRVCVFMNNENRVSGSALTYLVDENTLLGGKNPETGDKFTYIYVEE
jgi:hypothetical protein